jgi:hypothetical protein
MLGRRFAFARQTRTSSGSTESEEKLDTVMP